MGLAAHHLPEGLASSAVPAEDDTGDLRSLGPVLLVLQLFEDVVGVSFGIEVVAELRMRSALGQDADHGAAARRDLGFGVVGGCISRFTPLGPCVPDCLQQGSGLLSKSDAMPVEVDQDLNL